MKHLFVKAGSGVSRLNSYRPMENDKQKIAQSAKTLEPEAFRLFLEQLAPEPEAAGREYELLRRKLSRYFMAHGELSTEEAADEAIDRVVGRIGAGVAVGDITKFSLGIARFVALERFRKEAREQQAWFSFADTLTQNFDEGREQVFRRMTDCLAKLEVEDRDLLLQYYENATSGMRKQQRADLADNLNATINTLRLRVFRLRQHLLDCLKS